MVAAVEPIRIYELSTCNAAAIAMRVSRIGEREEGFSCWGVGGGGGQRMLGDMAGQAVRVTHWL